MVETKEVAFHSLTPIQNTEQTTFFHPQQSPPPLLNFPITTQYLQETHLRTRGRKFCGKIFRKLTPGKFAFACNGDAERQRENAQVEVEAEQLINSSPVFFAHSPFQFSSRKSFQSVTLHRK